MAINPILRLAQTVDRQLKQAGDKSPGVRRLTRLFEVIHFTSLKTEEGKTLQLRIALVDPANPDPEGPVLIRPDRWTITRLDNHIPLAVPSLIKLSKAADPWSSTLAVFYDCKNEFFVWGMIEDTPLRAHSKSPHPAQLTFPSITVSISLPVFSRTNC